MLQQVRADIWIENPDGGFDRHCQPSPFGCLPHPVNGRGQDGVPLVTLVGLVGSACRLRPDDAEVFLHWGRDFVTREMPRWEQQALSGLQDAPRLPGYWTGLRKLLGLQGEPNI